MFYHTLIRGNTWRVLSLGTVHISSPLLGGPAPRLPSGDWGPFNDFSWEFQTKTENVYEKLLATLQQQKSRARRIDWKRVYLCIFRVHLLNTIPTCALAPHWNPDAVTPIPGRLQTPIFGAISLNPGRRFGNNVSWKQFRPRNPPWVGRIHRQF